MHAIPVTAGNKREVVEAIERARAELAAGHVVCIFAEGAVSRTGNLLPFKRGFERIVARSRRADRAGVSRSRLGQHLQLQARASSSGSCRSGCPTRSRSRSASRCRRASTASEVRLAIMELGAEAMRHRRPDVRSAAHRVHARRASGAGGGFAMADSTGQKLTLRPRRSSASMRARPRDPRGARAGEANVGLLLPASVGGALANIAMLDGRQGAGQPQLHDRAGSAGRRDRRRPSIHDDRHVASGSSARRRSSRAPGDGVPRRPAQGRSARGDKLLGAARRRALLPARLLRRALRRRATRRTRSRRSSSRAAAPACRRA